MRSNRGHTPVQCAYNGVGLLPIVVYITTATCQPTYLPTCQPTCQPTCNAHYNHGMTHCVTVLFHAIVPHMTMTRCVISTGMGLAYNSHDALCHSTSKAISIPTGTYHLHLSLAWSLLIIWHLTMTHRVMVNTSIYLARFLPNRHGTYNKGRETRAQGPSSAFWGIPQWSNDMTHCVMLCG